MITYKEYSPTQFDAKGLGLNDNQNWLVLIGQNRDSDVLARSNYTCAIEALESVDPDGSDYEQHSFGHWACGWLEVVIVRPGSKAYDVAVEIEACLADYPVLNDDHYSELEWSEHADWVDRECGRVANDNDQDLTDTYCAGTIAERFQWNSEHDRSPDDEDLHAALADLGFLKNN